MGLSFCGPPFIIRVKQENPENSDISGDIQENMWKPIAHIRSDFPTKFGIPRQSGLAETKAKITFEPEYRVPEAFRGLDAYSHIWLIWEFSESVQERWHPTVRPPRLGGNQRVGVFATRSPFRPNPVGLSCVRLDRVELDGAEGPELFVSGADLMDGTPVYDIKPYLPYVDSHPKARGGFSEEKKENLLEVQVPEGVAEILPDEQRKILTQILAQDPRPSYQNDPERVYGMEYAGWEIKFRVKDHILLVCAVEAVRRGQITDEGR